MNAFESFSEVDSPILQMPDELRNQIAAGEVIERPASVVKEAVENSLDARATWVQVTLKQGGRESIEILDNGKGIRPLDLPLALSAHATSKLKKFEDLKNLSSFGFRGEALASFAACGDLAILSRHYQESEAYEIRNHSVQKAHAGLFLGLSHGTKLTLNGLFSKTPARLSFLKAPGHEVTATKEMLERLSLTYPHVRFTLKSQTNDEMKTVLDLASASEKERAQSLLGPGPLKFHEEHFSDKSTIRVYWLQGSSQPNAKKMFQIVNKRAVKDRLIQQALLKPFRQSLLPGQSPAVVLFLEVAPESVDVNVHPMKTELRFLDSSAVFGHISKALENLISTSGMVRTFSERTFSEQTHTESPQQQARFILQMRDHTPATTIPSHGFSTPAVAIAPVKEQTPILSAQELFSHLYQSVYAGQLLKTYLAFETKDTEIYLVDQHAAHERIRFEQLRNNYLKRGNKTPEIESLLIPIRFDDVSFSDSDRLDLLEEVLARLGFVVHIDNNRRIELKGIPAAYGNQQLEIRFLNLLERVRARTHDSLELLWDETVFEELASEACHSSIRAGKMIREEEARSILKALAECEHPWNCPHGRPTLAKIPAFEFESLFLRRVTGSSEHDAS